MSQQHDGKCFCGTVQIQVTGEPQAMSYCHCESCRSWAAAPLGTSSIWKSDAVKVVAGEEYVKTFQKTPDSISHRQYCELCGGHLMISHPDFGLFDVFPAMIPTLDFQPTMHMNYSEAVLPMADGLLKYRDFPSEFGGSGELVAE